MGSSVSEPRGYPRGLPACAGSGPEKLAIVFGNGQVVDAGFPAAHQAVLVKLPDLVAVAAMPLARGVVPFKLDAHCDAVIGVAPQVFDEPVIEFTFPLVREIGEWPRGP